MKPGADLRALPLTQEEGFIASRLDGATDLHGLGIVTGLAREILEAALARLVSVGVVLPPEGSDRDPPALEPAGVHRKLFETTLHRLASEERPAKAKAAVEPELSAFCFDPLPAVIHALLENPRFGLVQARLVAAHHGTPAGLEALAARSALIADGGVRRALLRNPHLTAGLLRRLQSSRRLLEQHELAVSRDVPEQTRRAAREILRTRFTSAEAEERVELIVKTEGRCLTSLAGLGIDGKTTALLCARTYGSTLLLQNFSRWAACPPALIAHLMKQELVRRSPSLKLLLQRNPNARAD